MPGKLQKFADFENFSNCHTFLFSDLEKGSALKGNWREKVFKNNAPVVLELGCGKGEYTVGLAQRHPEKNYIGVDIKGNRIWTGAKTALEKKLPNVAFLRTRIDFIDHSFIEEEVDEIWITFPDPQPQKTRARKRLTHPVFLQRYRKFLKPTGILHLKTDNTGLYEFTMEVLKEEKCRVHFSTDNLYANCPEERKELTEIKTHYEALFTAKGEDIKYVCFSF